jgi:hypothetical protein
VLVRGPVGEEVSRDLGVVAAGYVLEEEGLVDGLPAVETDLDQNLLEGLEVQGVGGAEGACAEGARGT